MKLKEAKEILMAITPSILTVVCFGFLAACNAKDAYPPIPTEAKPKDIHTSEAFSDKSLSVIHIDDKQVTCFLFESRSNHASLSVSCIPDNQISYGNPESEGDK